MGDLQFKGRGPREAGTKQLAPLVLNDRATNPEFYDADDTITDAVNVALLLGRPLLVTGEAGTGKTQLAYRMAWELTPEDPVPLRFQVKARSEGNDLFYRYDALRHFQDSQRKQEKPVRSYIRIEALGRAILRANPGQKGAAAYGALPEQGVRSVVLIDEIDKAPRDLPNDILSEIEDMRFDIKETEESFRAQKATKPVVVLTSNSERDLPDAFLRRCVYLHIKPPNRTRLRQIVAARLDPEVKFSPQMLDNAVTRYEEIREIVKRKKPSTDELIAWSNILAKWHIDPKDPRDGDRERLLMTYSVLVKDPQDLELVGKKA